MEKERVESDWLQAALSRHPRLDFAGRTSIDSPKVKGAKDILMFVAPKEPIGDSDRLFNFQNEVQDYIFDRTRYHLPVGCAPRFVKDKFQAGMYSDNNLRIFLFPDKISAEEALKLANTPKGQKDFSFMYLNREQLTRFNQRAGVNTRA